MRSRDKRTQERCLLISPGTTQLESSLSRFADSKTLPSLLPLRVVPSNKLRHLTGTILPSHFSGWPRRFIAVARLLAVMAQAQNEEATVRRVLSSLKEMLGQDTGRGLLILSATHRVCVHPNADTQSRSGYCRQKCPRWGRLVKRSDLPAGLMSLVQKTRTAHRCDES